MKDLGHCVVDTRRHADGFLQAYSRRRAALSIQQTIDPWVEIALLIVFMVAFWLIASNVPANGDDWAWGSEIGIARLENWFEGYNGRYTGNIIVLILMRLGRLTPLIQAGGLAVMIGIILDITHNRTILGYVTLSALIFFMPAPVWRQTLVWVSGYANYVTATLSMLILIRSVLLEFSGYRKNPLRPIAGVGIFAFAVASQLVLEHMTIYLFVASVVALLAGRFLFQQFSPRLLIWMAGFGVGAVVMFSNSFYRDVASGESVKSLSQEGSTLTSSLAYVVRDRISTYGLTANAAVVGVIAALIAVAAVLKAPMASHPTRSSLVRASALFVGVTIALVAATRLTIQPISTGSTKTLAASALVLGLIIVSTQLLSDISDRMVIAISVGSWLLLNAPLLMVYPIPPRTFMPGYALLLMIVSVLTSNFKKSADAHTLVVITTVVAVAGFSTWSERVAIYSEINDASIERIALVRQQIGDGESNVEVKRLPHREWMARGDPFQEPYPERFKRYYDLPESISISPAD